MVEAQKECVHSFFFCAALARLITCFYSILRIVVLTVCVVFHFYQELEEIRRSGMKNFRNIQVEESNLLSWQGLIVPVSNISFFTLFPSVFFF